MNWVGQAPLPPPLEARQNNLSLLHELTTYKGHEFGVPPSTSPMRNRRLHARNVARKEEILKRGVMPLLSFLLSPSHPPTPPPHHRPTTPPAQRERGEEGVGAPRPHLLPALAWCPLVLLVLLGEVSHIPVLGFPSLTHPTPHAPHRPTPRPSLRGHTQRSASTRRRRAMSTAARRRLMRDLKRLQSDPPQGVQGAPLDNNVRPDPPHPNHSFTHPPNHPPVPSPSPRS